MVVVDDRWAIVGRSLELMTVVAASEYVLFQCVVLFSFCLSSMCLTNGIVVVFFLGYVMCVCVCVMCVWVWVCCVCVPILMCVPCQCYVCIFYIVFTVGRTCQFRNNHEEEQH